jgi:hypothetical protein
MEGLSLSPETLAALQQFREQEANTTPIIDMSIPSPEPDSVIAADNRLYKTKEYWDDRFQREDSYDWLLTYQHLKSHVTKFLRPEHRILIVGCGNSHFSASLYDDGFHNIVNIDFSGVVIEKMKQLNESRPEMLWLEMDMCKLAFEAGSFDVVIDKASMDALLVNEGNVWDPSTEVISSVDEMCRGISQVLSPQGCFLQISFSQPHFRTKYLMAGHVTNATMNPYASVQGYCELYNWTLSVEKLVFENGSLDTFLYIMLR